MTNIPNNNSNDNTDSQGNEVDFAGLREKALYTSQWNADFYTPEDQAAQEGYVAQHGFKKVEGEDGTSIFVGRKYPTLERDPITKKVVINMRRYNEPSWLLARNVSTIPVYISSSVRNMLQKEGTKSYKAVVKAVEDWAATSQYPHLIVLRKGKMFVSKLPFSEHPWVRHFANHCEIWRNEALAVAFAARGIMIPGNQIPTPALFSLDVPDGVFMLLKRSTGQKLGYYPGMWQGRMIFPFVKGLMVVWHDDSVTEFFNTDVVKLKMTTPEGEKIMESIPDIMSSDHMLFIANSDELYDMRASHQMGYCFEQWGDFPDLIANAIVKEIKDKTYSGQFNGYQIDRVAAEELMPDYIRMLDSAGFPKRFLGTIQQIQELANAKSEDLKLKSAGRDIVDTVLLAARPKVGKMAMFAALPKSHMGGMKVGWYKPDTGLLPGQLGALSDVIGRVPFLAIGGGIQKVEWAGISPLKATIIAIVEDITPQEHKNEKAALERGEKYKRKDSKLSAKIWKQIMAMGADSDGDRIVIMTEQGKRMMESAGLIINENPMEFKSKLPYPNISGWSKEMVIKFWIASTPRVNSIGKADTITRDALDLYMEGVISRDTFYKVAITGSAEVQLSVSASKYYGVNEFLHVSPLNYNDIKKIVTDSSVGLGRKFHGMLWDKARAKAEELVLEYLPEQMEEVTLAKGSLTLNWKGGYTQFNDALKGYSPEQGTDFPSVVRNAFIEQLALHGITVQMISQGLRPQHAEMVHRLIRKYIREYPHRINVWCWMLDERLTKVSKENILETIGLPFEPKEDKQ